MIFTESTLKGAFIIEPELKYDSRGYFARTFSGREFEEYGLQATVAQCNLSFNTKKGTVRGMHYLAPPGKEAKLVRVIRGALHDVIVDLRPKSPTYGQHISVELTAENRWALYVPPLFAHGFQTLVDDTEVFYQMSDFYAPEYERGLRYDDPALGISWPMAVSEISEKDKAWPPL